MTSEKDLEKMGDNEEHRLESTSPTLCSNPEKVEDSEKRTQDEPNGYPDFDHEETEEMDAGHQFDLAIQQVSHSRTTTGNLSNSQLGNRINQNRTTKICRWQPYRTHWHHRQRKKQAGTNSVEDQYKKQEERKPCEGEDS